MDGTVTTTDVGAWGQLTNRVVEDIASQILLVQDIYGGYDSLYRSYTVTHMDGTSESFEYACCGLDTATDRDGCPTQYYYDAADRQTGSMRLGITTTNVLDAAGHVLQTWRLGTNGPMQLSGRCLRQRRQPALGNQRPWWFDQPCPDNRRLRPNRDYRHLPRQRHARFDLLPGRLAAFCPPAPPSRR